MHDSTEILSFIDTFLAQHIDWLPDVTVNFALDLRSLVEAANADAQFEVAA